MEVAVCIVLGTDLLVQQEKIFFLAIGWDKREAQAASSRAWVAVRSSPSIIHDGCLLFTKCRPGWAT